MKPSESNIRQYVQRSAGNCNQISDHVMTKFVCMVEAGEYTYEDFGAMFVGLGEKVFRHKLALDSGRKDR